MESAIVIGSIASGALITAFYGFFISIYLQRARARLPEQRFFNALREYLERDFTEEKAIGAIALIYRGLSENYTFASESIRGPIDLVERFVYLHDTEPDSIFKRRCGFEKDFRIRDRAYSLLTRMKAQNPFSNLPTKAASLMRNLQGAVLSANQELGESALGQVSEEIELLDRELKGQERANRTAFAVAALGVVLTAAFGVTSVALVIAR